MNSLADVDISIDARVGDSMICPGCGEKVSLDWADGWRNDNGFTCKPARTTHSQHILTVNPDMRPVTNADG